MTWECLELQQNTNAWDVNDNKIKEVYHHKPIPINSSFTEFLYKQVHKLIAKYQDVQILTLRAGRRILDRAHLLGYSNHFYYA